MHAIWCLHHVGENLGEKWKKKNPAKYVVEWYNLIGLFNKQTYIIPMNPIVIIFCH